MRGDEAGGESAAAHARDLQPPKPLDDALDAPVPVTFKGIRSRKERRETRDLQASVDRRMADQQLLRLLADDGFEGRRYEMFANDLARYGMSVLRAWMYTGYIFSLTAARGFDLKPSELDLEKLHRDGDLRGELATMTVAKTLPRFRRQAFIGGGWTVEGGAGITTYFMGATLYDFPNEFRAYRSAEAREREARRLPYLDVDTVDAVEDDVVGRQWTLETLKSIKKDKERAVMALSLDGYTQEEIREILGLETERAVEGVKYRAARKIGPELRRQRRDQGD